MPKNGVEHNLGNIDSKMLQDFQLNNITPEKVTVLASGLRHHDEFYELASDTLGVLNPVREMEYRRKKSHYIGGEHRTFSESPDTNILLAYESVNWTDSEMPTFAVMHTLFGSATGFSTGGPGKGMLNRANNDILRQKFYMNDCESINLHFTDSGLFGLNFTGSSSYCKDILLDMLAVFEKFQRKIDETELNRAKNILKRTILVNLSNQMDRLEEVGRTVYYFLSYSSTIYIKASMLFKII